MVVIVFCGLLFLFSLLEDAVAETVSVSLVIPDAMTAAEEITMSALG